jgi:hypothetical protein
MHNNLPIKLSALALAVGFCFATPAFADNSTGTVYGQAKAGTTVTVVSVDTGLTRQVMVDANGRYRFAALPTGKYKVTSDGQSRDITVSIGTGSAVSFDDGATEVISVTGSRISAIDVTSVESTTVFTADQLEMLPVGRNLTAVALLAPGTVAGDSGFGNLASFGGASVAENGYYLNGFDITNARSLTEFATLPFDAIAQQQIKTGGYGAEYGRSLGGVINVVSKKGTNNWEFGASMYLKPQSLRASAKDSYSYDEAVERYQHFNSANTRDEKSYVLQAGGPLIEDTLFVYGMVEANDNEKTNYDNGDSGAFTYKETMDSPMFLLKIDWNITENHILEFTGLRNKTERRRIDYQLEDESKFHTGVHGAVAEDRTFHEGGDIMIGKYTGIITDDFSISATIGSIKNEIYTTPDRLDGWECPRVWDGRTNPSLDYMGCWNQKQVNIRDTTFGPDTDERLAYRLDAEYRLGDHTLRAGLDLDTWTSGHAGEVFTGIGHNNYYYRYYRVGANGSTVNGVKLAPGTEFVRTWDRGTGSAEYEVKNEAFYIEDSWQMTDRFMLYAGLRSEGFSNTNASGEKFVEAKNNIAPRLGFSFDVNGDSSQKIYGTLGRYYIPVAANTNIRAAGLEWFDTRYWLFDGQTDATTGAPIKLGSEIGTFVAQPRVAANPGTIAVTNLKPMHQDELIIGYQTELMDAWSGGVKFVTKKVQDGMDDYCSHQPFIDWAEDQGYDNFDVDSMAGCIIMNPGNDFKLMVDVNGDGNLVESVIPNSYLKLPKYDRTYNALEFSLSRDKQDGWYMNASYTLAKSEGNIEGYVNSTLEQDDAGLTQDFDHERFQTNTDGYLPNDRRHTFKIYGGYDVTDEIMISANINIASGRPVNCNGYVPLDGLGVDSSGLINYGPSAFYCVDDQGVSQPTKRGQEGRTPWTKDVGMSISYIPEWADNKLTLQATVYNLFNTQEVIKYNETGDYDRATTRKNLNFKTPTNFQAARSVDLIVRYSF